MGSAPIHFMGRIIAIVLLVGSLGVFVTSQDLWGERSADTIADATRALRQAAFAPSSVQFSAAARTSVQDADADVAVQTSVTQPQGAATLEGSTAQAGTSSPKTTTVFKGLRPSHIVASTPSTADNAVFFAANNVSDGRLATAWGVPGAGSGQSITLMFDGPIKLRELQIATGASALEDYHSAAVRRAKLVRLEFTNASVEAPFEDSAETQSIKLDGIVTSFVRVVLLESYAPQSAQPQSFTTLNEIVPLGDVCAPDACGAFAETIRGVAAMQSSWGGGTIIEKTDGDFARVVVPATNVTSAPAIVLLKHQAGQWVVLASQVSYTPEQLKELGVSPSLLE